MSAQFETRQLELASLLNRHYSLVITNTMSVIIDRQSLIWLVSSSPAIAASPEKCIAWRRSRKPGGLLMYWITMEMKIAVLTRL